MTLLIEEISSELAAGIALDDPKAWLHFHQITIPFGYHFKGSMNQYCLGNVGLFNLARVLCQLGLYNTLCPLEWKHCDRN